MDDIAFRTLLKNLPLATPEQLGKIRERLALLSSGQVDAGTASKEEEDWLLDGIIEIRAAAGLMKRSDLVGVRRSRSYPTYEPKAKAMRAFIVSKLGNVSPTQKVALGRLLAGALIDYLANMELTTLSAILNNVDKLPDAIHQAYPGYLESKMLIYLVERRA